jgi:hypothetical protein
MRQDINFSEYEKGRLEGTQRGLSLSLFDPEYSAELRVKLNVKVERNSSWGFECFFFYCL